MHRTTRIAWLVFASAMSSGLLSGCGRAIKADYCVGVSTDEFGAIGPDDNAFIVSRIDEALLPLGYQKADSPAIVEYFSEVSIVNVRRNLGPIGTEIAHFSISDKSDLAGRQALITVVENQIRLQYLVRTCEEIYPGSTPTLYD